MLLTYLLTYYTPCTRFTNNDIAATKAVDSANNYKCTKCHQQAHVGIALLQQNPPVLGYGAGSHRSACTLYGHETIISVLTTLNIPTPVTCQRGSQKFRFSVHSKNAANLDGQ